MAWRDLSAVVSATHLNLYRRLFGLTILLELLTMTDSIIHVVYENWEPCFLPAVRDWDLPVSHYSVDFALYLGMAAAILFIFDKALGDRFFDLTSVSLLCIYFYLRAIHFYAWNNHYYLNMLLIGVLGVLGNAPLIPLWQYSSVEFLLGSVYFLAGLSKISTAWMQGEVTETMIASYSFLLPNWVLVWGGLFLDLLGGLVVMIDSLWAPSNAKMFQYCQKTTSLTQLMFVGFHAHNLLYMFKSIKFFPLHMLFTTVLFVRQGRPLQGLGTESVGPEKSIGTSSDRATYPSLRVTLTWAIILAQFLFALRRFFILVDYPWEIVKANDIAEFHSQVHHFSWRMKSRTTSATVSVRGKWPTLATVGVEITDNNNTHSLPVEQLRQYVPYSEIFSVKFAGDPECAVQPLINRVKRQFKWDGGSLSSALPTVHLYWWMEVNHNPYQLMVNPEYNFYKGQHLPLLSAPSTDQLEGQIFPAIPEWKQVVKQRALNMIKRPMNTVPFISRAVPSTYIPNPLITAPIEGMTPEAVFCVYGLMHVRMFNGTEFGCSNETASALPLPTDGKFHLKFLQETLFVLLFHEEID